LVALQRAIEVRISRRHEAALKRLGGVEHAPEQMPVMIAVHTLWLIASVLEVVLLQRTVTPWLAASALGAFCVGQALRLSAISALGGRWSVKVITLPDEPRVTSGVFRYVRHPNYLGVVLEIAALPLIHGAWLTALTFSIANGLLLAWRIPAEERALGQTRSALP
jgi:methyltransferase